jgi:hypothetical protein
VESVLRDAEFQEIEIDETLAQLHLGRDVDEVVSFLSEIGPLSRVLTELDAARGAEAIEAVRAALLEHGKAGDMSFGAACWIVRAKA